ncbi:ferredoxin family protein [Terrilactibacillus sp. S3-3]|nr:ferredoxin family protein [Terrilactibacillus sp. S3-3]
MAFVITSACKNEKAAECAETCPVDCISEGEEMYFIDPDVCIDCGACEAVCPVEAIYPEDEVPEDEQGYIQLNRDFFAEK